MILAKNNDDNMLSKFLYLMLGGGMDKAARENIKR
jgi:hypothetical protein